jgi:hypothetical protein
LGALSEICPPHRQNILVAPVMAAKRNIWSFKVNVLQFNTVCHCR